METGIHELTAGYALDALDAEEREAYEAHLETCEPCQAELASFWETADALALASAGPAPSAALRERILADAREERQVVVPFERPRRPLVPVFAAVAAVAAAVAIGIGVWANHVSGELDRTRSTLEVLVDPGSQTVGLTAGQGRLVVDPHGQAVLVVHGLSPAPAGKTYETWIIDSGKPVSAGLFGGQHGTSVVDVAGRVGDGSVVAVTVEQDGGADAPTTKPVVASQPV